MSACVCTEKERLARMECAIREIRDILGLLRRRVEGAGDGGLAHDIHDMQLTLARMVAFMEEARAMGRTARRREWGLAMLVVSALFSLGTGLLLTVFRHWL